MIQNALDATRCQLYYDLAQAGVVPPEYPTQVDEARRFNYPLRIVLTSKEMTNELSGEKEMRQVFTIADCGIGMDREIIERYFLQIGRSFYTTDEFRRAFRFAPTSRFGVGFLSVFAVSDQVTVDTFKPTSPQRGGPVRLTLTGPRNYLLTEVGQRRSNGTSIEVVLREPLESSRLTNLVRSLCKRVEFPIRVNDLGVETVITAERPEQFTYEMPDVTKPEAKFVVRAFPVNRPGIEGELYVLAYTDGQGERWDRRDWADHTYPQQHPRAAAPPFPENLTCVHGVTLNEGAYLRGGFSQRIDYRARGKEITLSRGQLHFHGAIVRIDPEIVSRWTEILTEHLASSRHATSPDGWRYKQRLAKSFPFANFWAGVPKAVRVFIKGKSRHVSLRDIQDAPIITSATASLDVRTIERNTKRTIVPAWDNTKPSLILTKTSESCRRCTVRRSSRTVGPLTLVG